MDKMEVVPNWTPTFRSRLSWGGLVAGAVVALALLDLLLFLGAAVGVSVADASRTGWEAGTVGAGVASVIFVAIATFFGAHVGVALSNLRGKSDAVLQGLCTWAVSFQAMAIYLTLIAAMGAGSIGDVPLPGAEVAPAAAAATAWWLFFTALIGGIAGMLGGVSAWPPREEEAGVPTRPRGEGIIVPGGRELTP